MVLIGFWVTRVIEDRHQVECGKRHRALCRQRDRAAVARVARGQAARRRRPASARRSAVARRARRPAGVVQDLAGAMAACSMRSTPRSSARNFRRPTRLREAWTGTVVAELDELARRRKREGARARACRCSRSTARSASHGRARSWRSPSSTKSPPRSARICGRRGSKAGWSSRRWRRQRWRCCRASSSAAAAPSSASAQALTERVAELSALLAQNRTLRRRVQKASRSASAINERYLRRIGADLHDGPAQLVALAALRMDSEALVSRNRRPSARAARRSTRYDRASTRRWRKSAASAAAWCCRTSRRPISARIVELADRQRTSSAPAAASRGRATSLRWRFRRRRRSASSASCRRR